MSDRTQGSVRTDSRAETGPAAAGPEGQPSASSTQAIPTTGAQRAVGPATGAVPVVPQPLTGEGPAVGAGAHAPSAPAPSVPGPTGPVTAPGAVASAPPSRSAGKSVGRGPRRARLQLRHIDTWSALKISLVLSIALFFIWMVAVGLLYLVLNGLGVFDTINGLVGQLGSGSESGGSSEVLTPGVVFGGAAIIGAINVVLLTALCTVGTYIYNLCSDLVGGLEVTLSERD
ncbi:DUF3566 domain-containing protein [Blastococcus sp. TBT05-19]|uniref:DUF3566 domain-containing protein n=1 Tax=Blastococcus sp. TBT05-19 TaxID=2250581 RepID=UPI000DEBB58B|nr:DUF3566 domain-containing protein [Blastococcus sp. TBT05-19]RBY92288.1 DUF3566 domain-containing protein [Blastococcus sp. TBT05-19]